MSNLLRTPFYNIHRSFNANMVAFAGWEMPLYYTSIIQEHRLVRKQAGLFDVSHMGEFEIEGEDSFNLIQKLITNDAATLNINQVLYTPMCQEDGGIIDDLLVYRLAERHFMFVVNSSNINKDYNWVLENAKGFNLTVKNISDEIALLALQGPVSKDILQNLVKADLNSIDYYWFRKDEISGIPAIISRTGYTGELGYEIFITGVHENQLHKLWDTLIDRGRDFGLAPCGLGARDTLRLEMKYALYGNDIDVTTNPLEAGLGWTVKFNKDTFNGKEALINIKKKGLNRRLIGFIMLENGIARHSYDIFKDGKKVGYVTSGSFSPSLERGIGMAYVEVDFTQPKTEFEIDIRGKRYKARVVETPFYKAKK